MSIKLPSGKEIEAVFDIVGINADGRAFSGYDNSLFDPNYRDYFDDEPDLTPDHRIELADIMLARWEAFKAAAVVEKTQNDRVEGRDAASSRRVPSHDGLCPDD